MSTGSAPEILRESSTRRTAARMGWTGDCARRSTKTATERMTHCPLSVGQHKDRKRKWRRNFLRERSRSPLDRQGYKELRAHAARSRMAAANALQQLETELRSIRRRIVRSLVGYKLKYTPIDTAHCTDRASATQKQTCGQPFKPQPCGRAAWPRPAPC